MPTATTHSSSINKKIRAWLVTALDVRQWDTFVWIVIALTIIGGFFRLYRLSETVMFLGDQGRDAIVVSRIFTKLDPIFIGPVTSVGNMYLGPLYYYFMLPFLWLSYPSPMGPVYAVALINTLLIPLLYVLGSRLVGKRAAIFATTMLAVSASAISISRFSWNPNPLPVVSIVWLYCLYRAALGKRWYWLGVSLVLAVMLQLHYITFLAVGTSGLVWLWRLILEKRQGAWRQLLGPTLIGVAILLAFQLPLFLFDTRHDWLNARQFVELFRGKDAFANDRSGIDRLLQIVTQSRSRVAQLMVDVVLEMKTSAVLLAYTVLGTVVVFWMREKRRRVKQAVQLLLLTVLVAVAGLSVYKNDVYLHYLGFLLPVVFLLYGYLFDRLIRLNKLQALVVGLALTAYTYQNVIGTSFVGGGPRLPMMKATAAAIHSHVEVGEPYSILLISESKDLYGMNYRYFLTTDPQKEPLDPELFGSAKKLFVLWEDKKVAEPLVLPLYELLVFDVATPAATFEVPDGPTVLELRKG